MIHDYGKIWHIGNRNIAGLLNCPVIVEEKVDGSQFSMMVDEYGVVHCRSKSRAIDPDNPDMFAAAVECANSRSRLMRRGWVYRGEYLRQPRHNRLAYDRVPPYNVILYDLEGPAGLFATRPQLEHEAYNLGMEAVPCLAKGYMTELKLNALLDTVSCLGGQKIEGVVVKTSEPGPRIKGKLVSPQFREMTRKVGKPSKSGAASLDALVASIKTNARLEKAVQHLTEDGKLRGDPRDIGAIIKELQRDVREECREEIADALLQEAMPRVMRMLASGIADWYIDRITYGTRGDEK